MRKQRGVVLLLVLWSIVLITALVSVLAYETRLSAQIVFNHQQAAEQQALIHKALRMAEMELMLARMPKPANASRDEDRELGERRNPLLRFNGQPLELSFPGQPAGVIIRIFDHTGRLNLRRVPANRMRELVKRKIGGGDDSETNEKLDELADAWLDWIDRDELERTNGAEKDYYEELDPPYEPRNGLIQTLEEVRLIRGYDEIFSQRELDTMFTLYGTTNGVNPNLASREVLLSLPGVDDEAVEEILTRREEEDIKNNQFFNEFMDATQVSEFFPWINFATSNFYTIAIQIAPEVSIEEQEIAEDLEQPEQAAPTVNEDRRAYMVTVQYQGANRPPRVLRVDPYGRLPDVSYFPELVLEED